MIAPVPGYVNMTGPGGRGEHSPRSLTVTSASGTDFPFSTTAVGAIAPARTAGDSMHHRQAFFYSKPQERSSLPGGPERHPAWTGDEHHAVFDETREISVGERERKPDKDDIRVLGTGVHRSRVNGPASVSAGGERPGGISAVTPRGDLSAGTRSRTDRYRSVSSCGFHSCTRRRRFFIEFVGRSRSWK